MAINSTSSNPPSRDPGQGRTRIQIYPKLALPENWRSRFPGPGRRYGKMETSLNLVPLEMDVLALWQNTRAFQKLVRLNHGGKPWSFLDGPITANNPMGVHHAWGRTLKDIFQRYHASQGRELRFQNGFDCQGQWVEVEVEKELGFSGKPQIEAYGVAAFVEACKERVRKFATRQTEQSIRLGYWMDWSNSYFTMSDENNYAVWAFLKKAHERGKIYKGSGVMPWCGRCGTGITENEMQEGYRDVTHTAIFVKFPLLENADLSVREHLLVWTTTPWSLSANVAAAVHPQLDYLKIQQGSEIFYVAKQIFSKPRNHSVDEIAHNLPTLKKLKELFESKGEFRILGAVSGQTLVHRLYKSPLDELAPVQAIRDSHRVVEWDEVNQEEGTGIVHIAPGCGKEDFYLAERLSLPPIRPVDENARFFSDFGFLQHLKTEEASAEIIRYLSDRDLLFAREDYRHSYPHCWRCKEPLIYRITDEWFIRMDWRQEIIGSAKRARWIPPNGINDEIHWLERMHDWMITKKRYWGLALPIFECGGCGHFEVIGSKEELKERCVEGWEEFEGKSPHRPYLDNIKIDCTACGSHDVKRIRDVGTPWLDASIVPFSTMGYFRDPQEFARWFPADFVVEAFPGQFRNWFYALLAVSTMMEGKSPFKTLLGHGLVKDGEGKAMHKSQGNAIWFEDAAETHGSDLMRLLYASSRPESNVHFGQTQIDDIRRTFFKNWYGVSFLFNIGVHESQFDIKKHFIELEKREEIDRWLVAEMQMLIRETKKAYEDYSAHLVYRLCYEFTQKLSNTYAKLTRQRLRETEWTESKRAAYSTLYEVIGQFNRVLAPITPFTSEYIYQTFFVREQSGMPESVHHLHFPQFEPAKAAQPILERGRAFRHILELGRSVRAQNNLDQKRPVSVMLIYPANEMEREAIKAYHNQMSKELNTKEIRVVDEGNDIFDISLELNRGRIGMDFKQRSPAIVQALTILDSRQSGHQLLRQGFLTLELEDGSVQLTESHFNIIRTYKGELSGDSADGTVIAFDRTLTPELLAEYRARTLNFLINTMRKEDPKVSFEDVIEICLVTEDEDVRRAILLHKSYLLHNGRAKSISLDSPADPANWRTQTIEGRSLFESDVSVYYRVINR